MIPELAALGLPAATWQEAVGLIRNADTLTATGQVREGQVVRYTDDSGASLVVLTAEPFTVWPAFAGEVQAFGSVTMLTETVGLIDIIDDDDSVMATLTALFAEGPLFAESDHELQRIILSLTVLGTRVLIDDHPRESLVSLGAAQLGSGAIAPHAQISLSGEIATVSRRTTALSGEEFWYLTLTQPWPVDVCLPLSAASDPRPGQWVHTDGLAVAGLMAPPTCGGCSDGGGCGGDCSTCGH